MPLDEKREGEESDPAPQVSPVCDASSDTLSAENASCHIDKESATEEAACKESTSGDPSVPAQSDGDEANITLLIKCVDGRQTTLCVPDSITIDGLTKLICEKLGEQNERTRLIYRGRRLEPEETLGHYLPRGQGPCVPERATGAPGEGTHQHCLHAVFRDPPPPPQASGATDEEEDDEGDAASRSTAASGPAGAVAAAHHALHQSFHHFLPRALFGVTEGATTGGGDTGTTGNLGLGSGAGNPLGPAGLLMGSLRLGPTPTGFFTTSTTEGPTRVSHLGPFDGLDGPASLVANLAAAAAAAAEGVGMDSSAPSSEQNQEDSSATGAATAAHRRLHEEAHEAAVSRSSGQQQRRPIRRTLLLREEEPAAASGGSEVPPDRQTSDGSRVTVGPLVGSALGAAVPLADALLRGMAAEASASISPGGSPAQRSHGSQPEGTQTAEPAPTSSPQQPEPQQQVRVTVGSLPGSRASGISFGQVLQLIMGQLAPNLQTATAGGPVFHSVQTSGAGSGNAGDGRAASASRSGRAGGGDPQRGRGRRFSFSVRSGSRDPFERTGSTGISGGNENVNFIAESPGSSSFFLRARPTGRWQTPSDGETRRPDTQLAHSTVSPSEVRRGRAHRSGLPVGVSPYLRHIVSILNDASRSTEAILDMLEEALSQSLVSHILPDRAASDLPDATSSPQASATEHQQRRSLFVPTATGDDEEMLGGERRSATALPASLRGAVSATSETGPRAAAPTTTTTTTTPTTHSLWMPSEAITERLPWRRLVELEEVLRQASGWHVPTTLADDCFREYRNSRRRETQTRVDGTGGVPTTSASLASLPPLDGTGSASPPLARFLLAFQQLSNLASAYMSQVESWQRGIGSMRIADIGHCAEILALSSHIQSRLAVVFSWLFIILSCNVDPEVLHERMGWTNEDDQRAADRVCDGQERSEEARVDDAFTRHSETEAGGGATGQDATDGPMGADPEDDSAFVDADEGNPEDVNAADNALSVKETSKDHAKENPGYTPLDDDIVLVASDSSEDEDSEETAGPGFERVSAVASRAERKRGASSLKRSASRDAGAPLLTVSSENMGSMALSPPLQLNGATDGNHGETGAEENIRDGDAVAHRAGKRIRRQAHQHLLHAKNDGDTKATTAWTEEEPATTHNGSFPFSSNAHILAGSDAILSSLTHNVLDLAQHPSERQAQMPTSTGKPETGASSSSIENNRSSSGKVSEAVRARFSRWTGDPVVFSRRVFAQARQKPFSNAYVSGAPNSGSSSTIRGPAAVEPLFALSWSQAASRVNVPSDVIESVPEHLSRSFLIQTLKDVAEAGRSNPDMRVHPERFPHLRQLIHALKEAEKGNGTQET